MSSASPEARPSVQSHVTIINADGTGATVVFSAEGVWEAPNWSPDNNYLLLNSQGKLWRLPVATGQGAAEPALVPTGNVTGINNDHGISPNGTLFVISAGHMYTLPAEGGEPRQITEHTPSYFHGWSPDRQTLAYCAQRNGQFDLYAIGVNGGPETRLTSAPGYDDGPDYSPDGRWIYFNSDRNGGRWNIWRIPAQGAAGPNDESAEQITSDEYEDWFPHPSPDGKWLVFLSFPPGTKGHPPNKNVVLRRMPLPASDEGATPGEINEIVELFGGQGTLNVNSWAPDSRRFAYVSYSLVP
jgi:Tol biopolymer transport system component